MEKAHSQGKVREFV